ncbi:SpoIIE family protein phosphatase [Zavarzinia sp. CC-PAN008]|uniref:SpoIIE family protein phosphatase n=1 Tax=Zavarzinia sp. CC-PAN008 TaxID=3243332 RepID=UPI003F744193
MTDLKSKPEPSAPWYRSRTRLLGLGLLLLMVLAVAVRGDRSGNATVQGPAPPDLLDNVRDATFDLWQAWAPPPQRPLAARVVALDEESLSRYGNWPWPRSLVARLVDGLNQAGAAAIGIDIIFAERDSHSLASLARLRADLAPDVKAMLEALPSDDDRLRDSLKAAPVVLAMAPNDGVQVGPRAPLPATLILGQGGEPYPWLGRFASVTASHSALRRAAPGAGLIAQGGAVPRGIPLLMARVLADATGRVTPTYAPALTLDMMALATLDQAGRRQPFVVEVGARGLDAIRLDDIRIPVDRQGRVHVRLQPSALSAPRIIPAYQVIEGQVPPGALAGRLVLVGATAAGLGDSKATPVDPAMPGVEIHAQLLDSFLAQQYLDWPAWGLWAELGLLLAVGLLVVLGLPYQHPRLALPLVFLVMAGALALSFGAFVGGLLIDGTAAALAALVLFLPVQGGTLLHEIRVRRQVAGELAQAQTRELRIQADVDAARTIQMGLLPRRFPAFPERQDFDLHAIIEPARGVGGDFYDFLLVDERHLFFAIADVSGKGIPAALFMAVTRDILHRLAAQQDGALSQLMDGANSHIAAANVPMMEEGNDGMFVTVLAGVLDTETGEMSYCSAGHDAPLVRTGSGAIDALPTEGGPPLGILDEFAYPVEMVRLEPGTTLVLYTDGVSEAWDTQDRLYGEARIRAAFADVAPGSSAEMVAQGIYGDLKQFAKGAEVADDITLLVVRWLGPGAAAGGAG